MSEKADLGIGSSPGTTSFGASAEDWVVKHCFPESQHQLILAGGNLQIDKRLISKQRPIGHGHREEQRRVVVHKQFMLAPCSAKDDVFGISIVLHPSLVNLVDQPPATSRRTLQHKVDIPVLKAVGTEGRKSPTCPK
jgi:hypothetical protein